MILAMIMAGLIILPTPFKVLVFLIDLVVPDPIPFADEIVMIVSLIVYFKITVEYEEAVRIAKIVSIFVILIGTGLLLFYF